jgi:soluble lytic murein transglycosylase-like protein
MRPLFHLALGLALVLPTTGTAAALEILSRADVVTYKDMFRAQRLGEHNRVSDLASKIDDPLLMGHVVAERLLHPKTRTPYKDLKAWLKLYNDHPQAEKIYALANRRAPKGATHNRPVYAGPTAARYSDPDTQVPKAAPPPASNSMRPKLLKRLKHNLKQNRWEDSISLLTKPSARILLGGEDWVEAVLDVSKPLMRDRRFDEVSRLAGLAGKYQTSQRWQVLWLAGLATYRTGDMAGAATTFRSLVYALPRDGRQHARAAFWAGRAYQASGNRKLGSVFMSMAAQNVTTFYGQLAAAHLKRTPDISWARPTYRQDHLKRLLKHPAVQRVMALAQLGEYALAQQELRTAYRALPKEMDQTLLSLSLDLHLPNVAFTLAHNLKSAGQTFPAGLYPVAHKWRPYGNYQVDPALILAIIRQESSFDPQLTSRAGARGLMQLMPKTANYIRRISGKYVLPEHILFRPHTNVTLGQSYLSYLQNKFNGNLLHVIAAYNAGPGNVGKWLTDTGIYHDDPLIFIESIPFRETRTYVKRVFANMWMYRHQFDKPRPTLVAMANNAWPTLVALQRTKLQEG